MKRWRRVPLSVVCAVWCMAALWGQQATDGLDMLSPLPLVLLQQGRKGAALAASVGVVCLQEGLASFALGATLAMLGLWGGFLVLERRLDPTTYIFMSLFSLMLAAWTYVAIMVVGFLHDFPDRHWAWDRIFLQGGVYFVLWAVAALMIQRGTSRVSFSSTT
jgi:hypothetical protein